LHLLLRLLHLGLHGAADLPHTEIEQAATDYQTDTQEAAAESQDEDK
jgi:hypothetical protein